MVEDSGEGHTDWSPRLLVVVASHGLSRDGREKERERPWDEYVCTYRKSGEREKERDNVINIYRKSGEREKEKKKNIYMERMGRAGGRERGRKK